jgi:hypothetical protein
VFWQLCRYLLHNLHQLSFHFVTALATLDRDPHRVVNIVGKVGHPDNDGCDCDRQRRHTPHHLARSLHFILSFSSSSSPHHYKNIYSVLVMSIMHVYPPHRFYHLSCRTRFQRRIIQSDDVAHESSRPSSRKIYYGGGKRERTLTWFGNLPSLPAGGAGRQPLQNTCKTDVWAARS